MSEDDFFCGETEHNLFSISGEVYALVIDAEEDYRGVYTDIWRWCPYCNLDKVGGGGFAVNSDPVALNEFICDGCNRKITWIHERRLRFS